MAIHLCLYVIETSFVKSYFGSFYSINDNFVSSYGYEFRTIMSLHVEVYVGLKIIHIQWTIRG